MLISMSGHYDENINMIIISLCSGEEFASVHVCQNLMESVLKLLFSVCNVESVFY